MSLLQVSISKIQPLDFVQEGRVLLDFIHKMDQGLPDHEHRAAAGPAATTPAGVVGGGPATAHTGSLLLDSSAGVGQPRHSSSSSRGWVGLHTVSGAVVLLA